MTLQHVTALLGVLASCGILKAAYDGVGAVWRHRQSNPGDARRISRAAADSAELAVAKAVVQFLEDENSRLKADLEHERATRAQIQARLDQVEVETDRLRSTIRDLRRELDSTH